jgi:Prealbumin-like fold domain
MRKFKIVLATLMLGLGLSSASAFTGSLSASAAMSTGFGLGNCGPMNPAADPAQNSVICAHANIGGNYVTQDPFNPLNRQIGTPWYQQGVWLTPFGFGACQTDDDGPPNSTSGNLVGSGVADAVAGTASQLILAHTADNRWLWTPSDGTYLDVDQRAAIANAMVHIARHDLAAGGSGLQTVYASLLGGTTLGYSNFIGIFTFISVFGRQIYDYAAAHPAPYSVVVSGGGAVGNGAAWSATATVRDGNGNYAPNMLVDLDWSGSVSGSVSSTNGVVSATTAASPSASAGSVSFTGYTGDVDLNWQAVINITPSNAFAKPAQQLFIIHPMTVVTGSASGTSAPPAFPTADVRFRKTVNGVTAPIAGIVFQVTDLVGNPVTGGITTAVSGFTPYVTLNDGNYLVKEISVPVGSGVVLNNAPVPFTVNSGLGATQTVSFSNIAIPTVATQVAVSNPLESVPTAADNLAFTGTPGTPVVGHVSMYFAPAGTPDATLAGLCIATNLFSGEQTSAATINGGGTATGSVTFPGPLSATNVYFFSEFVTSADPNSPYTGPTSCARPTEIIRPLAVPTIATQVANSNPLENAPSATDNIAFTGPVNMPVTGHVSMFFAPAGVADASLVGLCDAAHLFSGEQTASATIGAGGTAVGSVNFPGPLDSANVYFFSEFVQSNDAANPYTGPTYCARPTEIIRPWPLPTVATQVGFATPLANASSAIDNLAFTGKPGMSVTGHVKAFYAPASTPDAALAALCTAGNSFSAEQTDSVTIGASGTAVGSISIGGPFDPTRVYFFSEFVTSNDVAHPYTGPTSCALPNEIIRPLPLPTVATQVATMNPLETATSATDNLAFTGPPNMPVSGFVLMYAAPAETPDADLATMCNKASFLTEQTFSGTINASGTLAGSVTFLWQLDSKNVYFFAEYVQSDDPTRPYVGPTYCARPTEIIRPFAIPTVVTQMGRAFISDGIGRNMVDTLRNEGHPGDSVTNTVTLHTALKGAPKVCDASTQVAGPLTNVVTLDATGQALTVINFTGLTILGTNDYFAAEHTALTDGSYTGPVTCGKGPETVVAVTPAYITTAGGDVVTDVPGSALDVNVKGTFASTDMITATETLTEEAYVVTITPYVVKVGAPKTCSAANQLATGQDVTFVGNTGQTVTASVSFDVQLGYGIWEVFYGEASSSFGGVTRVRCGVPGETFKVTVNDSSSGGTTPVPVSI